MIEITNIIIPTFITTGLSGILGFLISLIANKFKVEINEHQQKITNMLPGYNLITRLSSYAPGISLKIILLSTLFLRFQIYDEPAVKKLFLFYLSSLY